MFATNILNSTVSDTDTVNTVTTSEVKLDYALQLHCVYKLLSIIRHKLSILNDLFGCVFFLT